MTEIWPPEGAIAHFRAGSMCRVSLDPAVDTFATGSYGTSYWTLSISVDDIVEKIIEQVRRIRSRHNEVGNLSVTKEILPTELVVRM